MSNIFKYTRAIVCGVPSSLPSNAQRLEESLEPIDLHKARQQHALYVKTLQQLGLTVKELEPDETCPDCVFVEDTAVCVGNTALVANLGHPTRQNEAKRMKETLVGMGFDVKCMEDPAKMDGGDVLFTGREFFIGLSKRTNKESIDALSKAFPDYPVNSINVNTVHLHLKSMMTMLGQDTIVIGKSVAAKEAWDELISKTKFKYRKVEVPEDHAGNCLYLNDTVVHLAPEEIPESISVYQNLPGNKLVLNNRELHKVDGCLTCLSILLE